MLPAIRPPAKSITPDSSCLNGVLSGKNSSRHTSFKYTTIRYQPKVIVHIHISMRMSELDENTVTNVVFFCLAPRSFHKVCTVECLICFQLPRTVLMLPHLYFLYPHLFCVHETQVCRIIIQTLCLVKSFIYQSSGGK